MDFQKGDVVRLKSGGPDMTIGYFEDDVNNPENKNAFAFCTWFVGKKSKGKVYPLELLEKA